MRIYFATTKLQKVCESEKRLRIEYGKQGEKAIRERLDDLAASTNAAMLYSVAGSFEELTGDRRGSMSMRLHGGYRLVFRPHLRPAPLKADGGLDLMLITEVLIDAIEDYH